MLLQRYLMDSRSSISSEYSSSSKVIIAINVFLVICIIGLSILFLILYDKLKECENTESPYCLQYVCPNGSPPVR